MVRRSRPSVALRAAALVADQETGVAPAEASAIVNEEDVSVSVSASPAAAAVAVVVTNEDASPAAVVDSPAPSAGQAEAATPTTAATTTTRGRPAVGRKRRLGRPPKNPPPDWDHPDDDTPGEVAETTTPTRRRRGRPSTGAGAGGRWSKPRGGPSHVTHLPVDKEGRTLEVIDDEVVLPLDPDGETKVDRWGHLQGERRYRCRTFTISGRGPRLYMLSTEPARCIGFRDSYLFFQKHKKLFKIIVDDHAKRDLIDREIIPHSYKGRAIGVVTARSVFREFGARIIVGGRRIVDDYDVAAARANGDVQGELADPDDRLPRPGEPYNQNQYVAWHGASSVYHSGAPSVPMPAKRTTDAKRKQVAITEENWMYEHCRAASEYNQELTRSRQTAMKDGVYDIWTNSIHWPYSTQPTRARWEEVLPPLPAAAAAATATSTDEGPDATTGPEGPEAMQLDDHDPAPAPTTATTTNETTEGPPPSYRVIYVDPGVNIRRNLLVVDTCMDDPPPQSLPWASRPGWSWDPDSTSPFAAKCLLNYGQDTLDDLPEECVQPFLEERDRQRQWLIRNLPERQNGLRARLQSGYFNL